MTALCMVVVAEGMDGAEAEGEVHAVSVHEGRHLRA
jgi:hypothetical protein